MNKNNFHKEVSGQTLLTLRKDMTQWVGPGLLMYSRVWVITWNHMRAWASVSRASEGHEE